MTTISSILQSATKQTPDKPLFVFPETRWRAEQSLTYAQLWDRALAAGGRLAREFRPGERALLLFPAGVEFWEALFGCLAAGLVAVPLPIPNLNRASDLLSGVCGDCRPSLLLTDETTAGLLQKRADRHPELAALASLTPSCWQSEPPAFTPRRGDPDETALLQYTSGSTSRPRGVQVSHANLLSNVEMIRERMQIREGEDSAVTWLPHYHDMGLIGSYLVTLATGNTTWCLPPEEFVISPDRWLRLISEMRATICGGPDFGYRRCAERITDDQLQGLDLSSWRVAYIGAEKVRPETLSTFGGRFARCGFRESAFFPCYGLAEATLMVTGGPCGCGPVLRHVSTAALAEGRVLPARMPSDRTTLVGCGQAGRETHIVIRDRETGAVLDDEHIGEICVAGPSVTRGYFNRQQSFAAFCEIPLAGTPMRFLLTGDLGFLSRGELFVTGRCSELMIVRGRNLYPEDIEERVWRAHPALSSGGAFAFSTDMDGREELIIAAELTRAAMRTADPAPVVAAIRQEVNSAFGVTPAEILLLRPATLPRTTSGKPQRLAVRAAYEAGMIQQDAHVTRGRSVDLRAGDF